MLNKDIRKGTYLGEKSPLFYVKGAVKRPCGIVCKDGLQGGGAGRNNNFSIIPDDNAQDAQVFTIICVLEPIKDLSKVSPAGGEGSSTK